MLNILKDRYIIQMYENFIYEGRQHIVFEFIDQNLQQVLENNPYGVDRD